MFFTITLSWQCWYYCQLCICHFLLYLQRMMSVNVKLENKGYMKIIFQGHMFYWNSWFLMAELKRSWQYWHSCIAESLWRTLLFFQRTFSSENNRCFQLLSRNDPFARSLLLLCFLHVCRFVTIELCLCLSQYVTNCYLPHHYIIT